MGRAQQEREGFGWGVARGGCSLDWGRDSRHWTPAPPAPSYLLSKGQTLDQVPPPLVLKETTPSLLKC